MAMVPVRPGREVTRVASKLLATFVTVHTYCTDFEISKSNVTKIILIRK
jgi:hypothetical protein